jgi:hypothetical protein
MPTPQQLKQLRDALISAFPAKSSLEQLLFFGLGKNLSEITSDTNLQTVVFQLIQTAESQGWLIDLVRAARKENPGNSELKALALELLPKESSSVPFSQKVEDIPNFEQEDYYYRLQKLLQAQAWLEADKETTAIILKVSGKEAEGWLELEDIEKLPCQDLYILNHLWLKYSNQRFGFTIQKRIWKNIRVTEAKDYLIISLYGNEHAAYAESYKYFSDRIGWHSLNYFLDYQELIFTLEAPEGHLPFFGFFKPFWRTRILNLGSAFALSLGKWGRLCSHFFSHLDACEL